MKLYDISQELFCCQVYPGDPAPKREILSSMADGELYNLTAFRMCAHNGTHVDAPFHFIRDGKTIDEVGLEHFVGMAYVVEHHGVVTAADAMRFLQKATQADVRSSRRLLIKGPAEVSLDAAHVFADAELLLLGNESQTVGPEEALMEVHQVLLGAGVVLLEGIRLADVAEGVYLLSAAPINLGGADGAPCRAVLMEMGI